MIYLLEDINKRAVLRGAFKTEEDAIKFAIRRTLMGGLNSDDLLSVAVNAWDEERNRKVSYSPQAIVCNGITFKPVEQPMKGAAKQAEGASP